MKANAPKKTPGCFISKAMPNNKPLVKKVGNRPDLSARRRRTKPPRAATMTKCVAWAAKPNTGGLMDIRA